MNGAPHFDAAALSYEGVAGRYEAGRPEYQDHIVHRVLELFDATPSHIIVDLAAGTGKLTRRLTGSGATVVAVEPVQAMAVELSRVVRGVPAVRALAGRLPVRTASIAGLSVAQAFQWFDHDDVPELARVLRPGGLLALVWNRRQDTADWAILDSVLAPYRRPARRRADAPRMLEGSGSFGPATVERWPWERVLSREQLHDHVASLSWIAALEPGERREVHASIDRALGDRRDHRVDYVSELVWARRR